MHAKDTLYAGNPRRTSRVGEARKAPPLHPPVPAREDAKAPEVRRMLQPGRGSGGSGLLLASVPEVVCLLQTRWSQGAAQKQSRRTRSPGVGHARGLRRTPGGHEEGRDSNDRAGSSVLERTRRRVLSSRRSGAASQAPEGEAQDRRAAARERGPPRPGSLQKTFAGRIRRVARREPEDKPIQVLAFDEARFGLINWHRR